MNKLQAEKKANSLNKSVKNPNIEYRVVESKSRIVKIKDDYEIEQLVPNYRVVQAVTLRDGETIFWNTY